MATITGSPKEIKVNISKFLGLYEAEDGDTAMKEGVSPKMTNFQITPSYHLKTRPGTAPWVLTDQTGTGAVQAIWSGFTAGEWRVYTVQGGIVREYTADGRFVEVYGALGLGLTYVHLFEFGGSVYCLSSAGYYKLNAKDIPKMKEVEGYIPLVVTGARPQGGGTTLEQINLLTAKRRVQFSADGTSTAYTIPETGTALKVTVNGTTVTGFTTSGNVVTLQTAPPQGVNNVEITYQVSGNPDRSLVTSMRYSEAFNGATDSRIFLYGDGTNILRYSGVTESGAPTAEYFPALNEIAIDNSNSPIRAAVRHYNRLMVFKPDGTWAVSYDTVTLADGTLTAGFHVYPQHREIGADAMGQVVTVGNFPRTFCRGSLYDWKTTASYYQDERYCRVASEAVQYSIRRADPDTLYMWDDSTAHRFYCFLNDDEGTVLVNAYEQGVWFVYSGENFNGVHAMCRADDRLIFGNGSSVLELSERYSYDYVPHINAVRSISYWTMDEIPCYWESGFMSFGSQNMRKHSSYIWATLKAGSGARMTFTAMSDRKPDYAEKLDDSSTTGLFDRTDFDQFSFETYHAPRVKRMKIKVKKFVYYKLIMQNGQNNRALRLETIPENDEEAGSVTVLNVDQTVRLTSKAK